MKKVAFIGLSFFALSAAGFPKFYSVQASALDRDVQQRALESIKESLKLQNTIPAKPDPHALKIESLDVSDEGVKAISPLAEKYARAALSMSATFDAVQEMASKIEDDKERELQSKKMEQLMQKLTDSLLAPLGGEIAEVLEAELKAKKHELSEHRMLVLKPGRVVLLFFGSEADEKDNKPYLGAMLNFKVDDKEGEISVSAALLKK